MSEVLLQLYVQPGAKKTEWCGVHGEYLKLRLHADPVEGKANLALINFLAREYAVKKQQVIIESGEHSRYKRVRIIK